MNSIHAKATEHEFKSQLVRAVESIASTDKRVSQSPFPLMYSFLADEGKIRRLMT